MRLRSSECMDDGLPGILENELGMLTRGCRDIAANEGRPRVAKPWLMEGAPRLPRKPQASFRHPLAERLACHLEPMPFQQGLGGQRWTEVTVVLPHQLYNVITEADVEGLLVAGRPRALWINAAPPPSSYLASRRCACRRLTFITPAAYSFVRRPASPRSRPQSVEVHANLTAVTFMHVPYSNSSFAGSFRSMFRIPCEQHRSCDRRLGCQNCSRRGMRSAPHDETGLGSCAAAR